MLLLSTEEEEEEKGATSCLLMAGRDSWIRGGRKLFTHSGMFGGEESDTDLVAVVEGAELRRFPLHRGWPDRHRADKH